MVTLKKLVSVSGDPDDTNECRGGNCPSVYKDELGNFYVQGTRINAELKSSISMPDNEDMVRIPSALITVIKESL